MTSVFLCIAVTQFCVLWQGGLSHYCHFSGNEETTLDVYAVISYLSTSLCC